MCDEERQLLRSWGLGPNRVLRIRCVRGEVAEGLAVVQPRLFGFLGGVGVIDGGEVVRLGDACVTLFTEFLEGLGRAMFLIFRD